MYICIIRYRIVSYRIGSTSRASRNIEICEATIGALRRAFSNILGLVSQNVHTYVGTVVVSKYMAEPMASRKHVKRCLNTDRNATYPNVDS